MRFQPSCSATLLLFLANNIPIFLVETRNWHVPVPNREERKKDTMFAAFVRFIQEWKRYNQSLNELSRLGDRELADIGISRSDIPRIAWEAAHR